MKRITRKLHALRDDPHMREVAKGTVLAFFFKVLGAGLSFIFNIGIARLFGAEGSGIYFMALSITSICSVVGRVGLDNTLLKFIAAFATHTDWGQVRAVYALSMKVSIAVSSAITTLVFLLAPWIAEYVFGKPELAEPLRWMSLSIMPFAILNLQAESMKGLKRIKDAMYIQGIALPLVTLISIYPISKYSDITGLSIAYSICTMIVALFGALLWRRATAHHTSVGVSFQLSELWASAKPLFITSVMNRGLMPWAPILLLGIWVGNEQVGIFSAATRVSLLISFMLLTINNVVAPKFAELYAKRDMVALGQTARRSSALLTALVSPLFIFLFIARDYVMTAFGTEFAQGGDLLAILLIGQFINIYCGSVGFLLMMSGNERTYRDITITAALFQLTLIILLTPQYGAIGVAVATASSIILMNLTSVYATKKKLGIMILFGFTQYDAAQRQDSKIEK
jgi:O-antigen/teichoic acid export membrane protein